MTPVLKLDVFRDTTMRLSSALGLASTKPASLSQKTGAPETARVSSTDYSVLHKLDIDQIKNQKTKGDGYIQIGGSSVHSGARA